MKIKFDKEIKPVNNIDHQPLKKRRWDRWVYLGILLFLVLSFVRWLTVPWFFDFAQGVLVQQQHTVQFGDDIRILKYYVAEDQQVSAGDTLFLYEKYAGERSSFAQDSIQMMMKGGDTNSAIIALNSQIDKRRLFLKDLQSRLQYWKAERQQKEKLVYLNVITPNELANVDRSIDDISYQIATLKAEYKVLVNERNQLRNAVTDRAQLGNEILATSHQKTYAVAPVSGTVDRLQIPEQQLCYRRDTVLSILYPNYYVRAYIDMADLQDFKVGDEVVVVLPYKADNLKGKVKKMYAVSELKDDIAFNSETTDKKRGIAVHIVPASDKGWDKLTVSNIPVKIRKIKINL